MLELYILVFLNDEGELAFVHTMDLHIAVMFLSVYPVSVKFNLDLPRELTVKEATAVVNRNWNQLLIKATKKLC